MARGRIRGKRLAGRIIGLRPIGSIGQEPDRGPPGRGRTPRGPPPRAAGPTLRSRPARCPGASSPAIPLARLARLLALLLLPRATAGPHPARAREPRTREQRRGVGAAGRREAAEPGDAREETPGRAHRAEELTHLPEALDEVAHVARATAASPGDARGPALVDRLG